MSEGVVWGEPAFEIPDFVVVKGIKATTEPGDTPDTVKVRMDAYVDIKKPQPTPSWVSQWFGLPR